MSCCVDCATGVDWPPTDSAVWTTAKTLTRNALITTEEVPAPVLGSAGLGVVANTFRPFVDCILREDPSAEEKLRKAFRCLDTWAQQFEQCSAPKQIVSSGKLTRLRNSSTEMLEALRLSLAFRGGAKKLEETVRRCLSIAMPDCLLEMSTAIAISKLPSSTSVQRNQLSLDMAFCLWRRMQYNPRTVRFLWQDSSPIGHDWLMSRSHEVLVDDLVDIAKSSIALVHQIRSFKAAQIALVDADEEHKASEAITYFGMEAQPSWRAIDVCNTSSTFGKTLVQGSRWFTWKS